MPRAEYIKSNKNIKDRIFVIWKETLISVVTIT